eukprot:4533587-Amphidinium_carterae.1
MCPVQKQQGNWKYFTNQERQFSIIHQKRSTQEMQERRTHNATLSHGAQTILQAQAWRQAKSHAITT